MLLWKTCVNHTSSHTSLVARMSQYSEIHRLKAKYWLSHAKNVKQKQNKMILPSGDLHWNLKSLRCSLPAPRKVEANRSNRVRNAKQRSSTRKDAIHAPNADGAHALDQGISHSVNSFLGPSRLMG